VNKRSPHSTQVDRGTWFGDQPDYTFGIQIMPVTPITELLVRPSLCIRARGPN
jgi:endoglucanase Acf2